MVTLYDKMDCVDEIKLSTLKWKIILDYLRGSWFKSYVSSLQEKVTGKLKQDVDLERAMSKGIQRMHLSNLKSKKTDSPLEPSEGAQLISIQWNLL